jgi:hypothetical protein
MFRRHILRAPRSIIVRSSLSTQKRQAHAISNPTLANIEKRWETLPPQEQADLWMALRDRMKANWAELTVQEKKAGLSSLPFPPFPSPREYSSIPRAQSWILELELWKQSKFPR